MIDFESLELTEDPGVRIVRREEGLVEYQTIDGERWVIRGQCSACGSCEVGVADGDTYQIWTGVPVGQPGACLDSRYGTRLDIPVRPEISTTPGCTLSGEYISGN